MEFNRKVHLMVDVLATAAGRMGPVRLRRGTEGVTDGVPIYAPGPDEMLELHVQHERGLGMCNYDVYFIPGLYREDIVEIDDEWEGEDETRECRVANFDRRTED